MEVIELDTGNWNSHCLNLNLIFSVDLIDFSLFYVVLCSDFGSTFSGVLTDEHGRVQAIWGSFSTQVYTVSLSKRKSKNKSRYFL